MSSGGSAPSSNARLSCLYVASAASSDVRATSRLPARLHHIPILGDDQLNGVTNLDFERGTGPSQISARDNQRRSIREQPAIAQQGLSELEAKERRDGGIDEIVSAVRRELGNVEISLKVSSSLDRLAVTDLRELVQGAQRNALFRNPREVRGCLRNRPLRVKAALHQGIKGRMRAQQPIFGRLDVQFLNSDIAVIDQRQNHGI